MAHIIALACAPPDDAAAETIAARLDGRHMPCWVASRDLPPGRDPSVATPAAFDAAQLVIVLLSGHSAQSPEVILQVRRSVDARQPVLGLRIENVALQEGLAAALGTSTLIDAFALPLSEHADRLADLLETAFEERPAGPN